MTTLDDDTVETLFARLSRAYPQAPAPSSKVARDPFRSVCSAIISAQTPDHRTKEATDCLFAIADTPAKIQALQHEALVEAIRPAGLYNNKAKSLKRLCAALLDEHDGAVPRERAALMALPGVGRKVADIVLRFAYNQPVCAVDTHVHRLCNRTGLAQGKTEAQTASKLEPRIPEAYGHDAHVLLITHAKRVCTWRAPNCAGCILNDLCVSYRAAGITDNRSNSA